MIASMQHATWGEAALIVLAVAGGIVAGWALCLVHETSKTLDRVARMRAETDAIREARLLIARYQQTEGMRE